MSLNGSLGLGVAINVVDGFTQGFDRFGAGMKHALGVSKEAAAGISANLRTFGAGAAVMGVGLAGLAAFDPALEEAKAFGKEIALVATEVDAATFSQAAMKRETRDLAGTFGRLPTDQAQALYKAVALGANDAAKSTYLMTAANQLAVAGNSELKVTMDALGGSLNAYHLQASDASMVSDAFFTAMRNGNTTVQDLAASVGRVSAGAHEMGISVQEVLGAVSVMTNKGIQASEAVSYLHGALANIAHPSHDAKAEAARLGITFNAAAVRGKGFVGFLHSIADNSKFTKDSLNKLFTSVEGSQAMAMLAGDMGSVDSVMKEMGKSQGATAAGFKIMTETADFQEKRFQALKHTALGLIGEALEPLKMRAVQFVNSLLDGFNKLSPQTQAFIVRGAALVATLVTIVGGVVALKAAMGLASVAFSLAGTTMAGAFLPVIAGLAAVGVGFAIFRQAYQRDLGGFRAFVDDTIGRVRLAWAGLEQVFSTGGFSGAVLKDLNAADNQGVKSFVVSVYVAVNRIRNFFDGLGTAFSAGLKRAEPAFDKFTQALDKLGAAFGVVGVDVVANGKKYDAYGAAGARVGDTLSKVVDVALHLGAAFADILRWLSPIIFAFADLVEWCFATESGMLIVRDVLYAMSAVKIAGWAEGAAAGIKAIGVAAGVGTAGVLAFTAAFAALGAAIYQAYKLYQEWDWGAIKKHLGETFKSQDERDKLALEKGSNAFEENQRRFAAERSAKGIHPPSIARPEPGPMPAVASAEGANQSKPDERLYSAVDRLAAANERPLQVDVPVTLVMPDGDVLASVVAQSNVSNGVRSGVPVSNR